MEVFLWFGDVIKFFCGEGSCFEGLYNEERLKNVRKVVWEIV